MIRTAVLKAIYLERALTEKCRTSNGVDTAQSLVNKAEHACLFGNTVELKQDMSRADAVTTVGEHCVKTYRQYGY